MYPDYLIAGKYVTLYGVMIAVGIVVCILVLRRYGKVKALDPKFMDFFEITGYLAIFGGFIASSVFQDFYNYLDNPDGGFTLTVFEMIKSIFTGNKYSGGGVTFIGGLIGGVVTFFIIYFIRRNKYTLKFKDIAPIVPSCILVAHGFGRIGCFFAGCCYGIETDSFLGVLFPGHAHKVYPTQLFEAAFLFITFGITYFLAMKKDFKYNFVIYLASYGTFRFLIEYVRGDDRGSFIPGISPSQFWSLLMIFGAIILFFLFKYHVYKDDKIKDVIKE